MPKNRRGRRGRGHNGPSQQSNPSASAQQPQEQQQNSGGRSNNDELQAQLQQRAGGRELSDRQQRPSDTIAAPTASQQISGGDRSGGNNNDNSSHDLQNKFDALLQRFDAQQQQIAGLQQQIAGLQQENATQQQQIDGLSNKITGIHGAFAPLVMHALLETCVYQSLGKAFENRAKYNFARIALWVLERLVEPDLRKSFTILESITMICLIAAQQINQEQGNVAPDWARTLTGTVIGVIYGLTVFVETVDVAVLEEWPPDRNLAAHDGILLNNLFRNLVDDTDGAVVSGSTNSSSVVDEDRLRDTWKPIFAAMSDDHDLSCVKADEQQQNPNEDKLIIYSLAITEAVTQAGNKITKRLGRNDDVSDRATFVTTALKSSFKKAKAELRRREMKVRGSG